MRYEYLLDFELIKQQNLLKTTKSGKLYIDILITPLFLGKNNTFSNYLVQIQDITKSKENEIKLVEFNEVLEKQIKVRAAELEESERKYRLITENLNDIVTVVNDKGIVEYINEEAHKKVMGYSINDVMNKDVFRLIHPGDRENSIKEFRKAITKGEGFTEARILHKDGTYIWTETNGRSFIDMDGRMKVLTISRDITKRKNAVGKLLESEEKFRTISDQSLVGIIIAQNGIIKYANKQMEKLSGYFIEEMKSWGTGDFLNLLHPIYRDFVLLQSKKREVGRNDVISRYQTVGIKKSGEHVCVDVYSRTIQYEGNPAILGILIDVTERTQAEEKLKRSEEKNRNLINSIQDIIYELDLDGEIRYMSPQTDELLGYKPDELIGFNALKFIHPDDKNKAVENHNYIVNTGEVGAIEIRVQHKRGHYITISSRGQLNKENNNRIIGLFRDITIRKEAEKALHSKQAYLESIFKAAPTGIGVVVNRVITQVNDQFCKLVGYSSDELINQNARLVYLNDEDYEFVGKEKYRQILENGIGTVETRFRRKNGKIIDVLLSSAPINPINLNAGVTFTALDITERKKTEQKIRESEKKLINLIEAVPVGISITTPEGKTIECNTKAYQTFGYHSKEEYINIPVINLYHDPSDRERFLELHKKGLVKNYEVQFRRKDGTLFWASLTSIAQKMDNQITFINSFQDITERKLAEQKLKQSENKYRTVVNNIPGMVYRGYPDWSVEFLSNSEVISGYTEMDFLTQKVNWVDIIHPDDKQSVIIEGSSVNKHPKSLSQVYRIITKNKSIRWVNDRKISFFDEKGNFCGVDGIVYDVTDYKLAEQNLKESEEKFRTIAEQTSLGLLIQQDGYIKFVNSAVADISEYPLSEIKHWSFKELVNIFHSEDTPIIHDKLKIIEEGASDHIEQFELRLITKSGNVKWIQIIAKPIFYIGEKAIFASIIDITTKKSIEEELKQISILKSELLSRTSHELKTPLVSIKGYTDLLLTQHHEMLDIYTISVLNEIKQGCYRLESLIKDLLETSKLESEEIEITKSEDDLTFLIKICIRELRGLLETRKHKLVLNIQNKMIAMMEKERIYEVIMNLISNAIKYTPPHGHISIISETKDNCYIISIKDDGIGLTKDEKEKIFKKFGKVERYGKRMDVVSEGTGLGLYISRKIIELHGGKIWVESEGRDKGSTFYFSLPIMNK